MPGLKQALLDPVPEVQKDLFVDMIMIIVMIMVMVMIMMVVYCFLVLSSLMVAMMTWSLFCFQPHRLSSVLLSDDDDDDDDVA